MHLLKIATTAALIASGATFALAQTSNPNAPPSGTMAQPGATNPDNAQPGATNQNSGQGSVSRPIGPPNDANVPAPGRNPTGESNVKRRSTTDDPEQGGKKQ